MAETYRPVVGGRRDVVARNTTERNTPPTLTFPVFAIHHNNKRRTATTYHLPLNFSGPWEMDTPMEVWEWKRDELNKAFDDVFGPSGMTDVNPRQVGTVTLQELVLATPLTAWHLMSFSVGIEYWVEGRKVFHNAQGPMHADRPMFVARNNSEAYRYAMLHTRREVNAELAATQSK